MINLIASVVIALSISNGGACRYDTPVMAEDGSIINCPYVYYGEGIYTTIQPTIAPISPVWRYPYHTQGIAHD